MADAEEVEAKLDDLKAAAQVVESIGDLIEASKSTAEQAIEKEFASIFAELESREEQLLKRAKAISGKKMSALKKHRQKLEAALVDLESGALKAELPRLEDGSIDPRDTV